MKILLLIHTSCSTLYFSNLTSKFCIVAILQMLTYKQNFLHKMYVRAVICVPNLIRLSLVLY